MDWMPGALHPIRRPEISGRLIGICSRQLESSQARNEDKEQHHSWHFKAIEDCTGICVCISPVQ